jgi:hypothetical protein
MIDDEAKQMFITRDRTSDFCCSESFILDLFPSCSFTFPAPTIIETLFKIPHFLWDDDPRGVAPFLRNRRLQIALWSRHLG